MRGVHAAHLLHLSEDILMGREFAIQTEEFLLLLSQLLYYGISMLSARFKKLDEMMIQRKCKNMHGGRWKSWITYADINLVALCRKHIG
jgi:hypothetical protein